MPKYRISAQVYSSISFVVEAEDEEEAREIASNQGEPGICYCCSMQNGYEEEGIEYMEFSVDGIGDICEIEVIED